MRSKKASPKTARRVLRRRKTAARVPTRARRVAGRPSATDKQLRLSAHIAWQTCMAVKPGESVLILTDQPERRIALALFNAAREMGNETILAEILPRTSNGEEPPLAVARLMGECAVVIAATSKSLTHTAARREACARGARVGTMPGITEDMMVRCLSADYAAIAQRSELLAKELGKGDELHITSPGGTDLTLYRGDRHAKASTGLLPNPGDFGNLPSGETYFAPIEGRSQGVIVFDGSVAGIGKLREPIQILVRDGYAIEITGGEQAAELNALLNKHSQAARNIAEFGIGTNDQAKITGLILEDEKVMGTVHIALGDNMSMGGTVAVQSHLDGLILKPTLRLDGRLIMDKGRLLIMNG